MFRRRYGIVFFVPAPWVTSGEQPACYNQKFRTRSGARRFADTVLKQYLNAYGILMRYEIHS